MQRIADGIDLTKDLGNLPANVCNPAYLADQARRAGTALQAQVRSARAEADGGAEDGSLLAVAQGSANRRS